MAELSASRTIGDRIAWWRTQRGWSQRQLAATAGLSAGMIGMLETGARAMSRRRDLYAIAEALQVTPEDLTGEPYPPRNAAGAQAHAALPRLRAVLLDGGLDMPVDAEPRPLPTLIADVAWVIRQWEIGRFDRMATVLPELFDELWAHSLTLNERDRRAALSAVVQACYAGYGLTKALGRPELACVAADRGLEAAVVHGSPALVGLAWWTLAMALERAGARRRAPAVTDAGLAAVDRYSGQGDPTDEMYGMLHLAAALFAARAEDRAASAAHLDEAAAAAARTGEADFASLHFGPTNVAMWRAGVAVELGDGPRALAIARAERPRATSPAREADYWSELARAAAQDDSGRQDRQAVQFLLRAEHLAAQKVHTDPLVRGIVEAMRARTTGHHDLTSLAARLSAG